MQPHLILFTNGITLTSIGNQCQNCKKNCNEINKTCNIFEKINTNLKLHKQQWNLYLIKINVFPINLLIGYNNKWIKNKPTNFSFISTNYAYKSIISTISSHSIGGLKYFKNPNIQHCEKWLWMYCLFQQW